VAGSSGGRAPPWRAGEHPACRLARTSPAWRPRGQCGMLVPRRRRPPPSSSGSPFHPLAPDDLLLPRRIERWQVVAPAVTACVHVRCWAIWREEEGGRGRCAESAAILRANNHAKSREPRGEYSEGYCEDDFYRVCWNRVLLLFSIFYRWKTI
jgi:hypothetical protein